jgi:predicted ATPase/class 3 adenylate cyclase
MSERRDAMEAVALLSAYLPMDRRHALAAGQSLPDRAEGAALLADIAGFTPLADALEATLGARRGVEELTHLLNAVYDALVAEVHHYGGSVVSFVGDALVCWFGGDRGLRAVACGLAMQRAMAPFVRTPISEDRTVSFSMKAGVAAGPVRRFEVGEPRVQRLDLLAGAVVDRMAGAEQVAEQGEVVVGPEVGRRLAGQLAVRAWRAGFGVVDRLAGEVPPSPWSELPAGALSVGQVHPYLLAPVYERLVAGQGEFLAELRPAVALFLRFGGVDYGREEAGPQLDAFVGRVQAVLARFEGILMQLTAGDKGSFLYATFGALAAHEDDAERALAAALELQQLTDDLPFLTDLQIGVSRGRMRVGAYGSRARRTYGAIGSEVVVACRLMEVAPVGEVRCSPAIYRVAGGQWAFEALPPVLLKGKVEPLPVFRPLRRARGRLVRAVAALVGRRNEVAILTRLLAEAKAGQRRVLLLEGEAGIGKSRLVAELARLSREGNVAWLEGAGQSIEQETPYRAWRDVLSAHLGLAEPMAPAERQRRVQEHIAGVNLALVGRMPLLNDILRLDLPETDLTQSFDPKLRHTSLTSLVVDLLRAATAGAPLVLVLEDAHWLDSLSWELALSAARALYSQPLLLVLVLRPLEAGDWRLDIEPRAPEFQYPAPYEALASLEGVETLRLEAMPREETVALAAARLGLSPEALPAAVADLVRERAGGNPFYAEELAYALRDSGELVVEEGACTVVGDPAALREHVPDTVEGVILSRIDRLPPEEQLTLKVAAVVGRSFLYRTLRDVHPRQVLGDLLRAHLDDLTRRDLTLPEALEPELTYLFKHVITQQVAYDTLLFAQRRELHRAVAGWYERVYAGGLDPYYPLLVHHWQQAEDPEQERRYCRLAGEQAAARYANAEALAYLGRALDLAAQDDLTERYGLLLAREKVYHLLGIRESQADDLATLGTLAEGLADERRQAEVALQQVHYAEGMGDDAAAARAAQEVIRLARSARDGLEAVGHRQWGRALMRQGDFDAARPQLEKALEIARKTSLRRVEAESLRDLGTICYEQSNFDQAQVYYEQALQLAREIGDRLGEGYALNNLGLVARRQADYARARDYHEQSLRIRREIGDRRGEGMVLNSLGILTLMRADYTAATAYLEQALPLAREIEDRWLEGRMLINLGSARLNLGDYAGARSHLERSLALSRSIGDRVSEGRCLDGLSLLLHQVGEYQAAREHALQALHLSRDLGDRDNEAYALQDLGHAQLELGNLAEAAAAYQQAVDLHREVGQYAATMEPLAGLARVSVAQGDMARARACVEETVAALETYAPLGKDEPFQIYLTCYQVLQAGGDPRAPAILDTAHTLLQEQAAVIDDEALRRSYLENVAAHRKLVAAYQAMQATGGSE